MNIGFVEAMKSASYDCVIFHDVDMLLEDDRHIYRCSDNIRHMGAYVNKFGYRFVECIRTCVFYMCIVWGVMVSTLDPQSREHGFDSLAACSKLGQFHSLHVAPDLPREVELVLE